MFEFTLLAAGWLAGLCGVAAALTSSFLARRPYRRPRRRWLLLWLVLSPLGCNGHCQTRWEGRPEPTGRSDCRPTHHTLGYEREGLG